MGLFDFNKKPKTKDVSGLDFKLFEKFGWKIFDVKDLKNFPVEAYFIDSGLKIEHGNGGLVIMPALFEGTFGGIEYSIWYELFCGKMRWTVLSDGVCEYETEDSILEEKHLIEIAKNITDSIQRYEYVKKQRNEIEELKKKPFVELTTGEAMRLGIGRK